MAKRYTDDEVLAVSRRMERGVKLGLFEARVGCVIGAKCTESHLVSLCIHPGYEDQPRPIDLYINQYLSPMAPKNVSNAERLGACIREYPWGAPRKQQYHWTIFHNESLRSTLDPTPRNLLFESFKCEDAKRTVWGNIVVVKTDRSGQVCDVKERDVFFIERLVYSYFEDDHADKEYPLFETTLFAARPDWGWRAAGGW